jgi:hypothetical protein
MYAIHPGEGKHLQMRVSTDRTKNAFKVSGLTTVQLVVY